MNLKRLALALLVAVLVIAAGAGGWWWWSHRAGPTAAAYLPEQTFLFVHLPDAGATRQAYLTSHLHAFIHHPGIGALGDHIWKEAWDKTAPKEQDSLKSASGLWQLLERNLTGEAFLAITQIDFQNAGNVRFVAGVKPKQGLVDIPPLVDRIKQLSADSMRGAKFGQGDRGGVKYDWVELDGGKTRLCYGALGPWEIVSISEPAFLDFVDRYQAKGKTAGSLAQFASYQAIQSRLPGRQDVLAYIGFEGIKPSLVKLTESNPTFRTSGSSLRQALDQLKAAGWGGKFENGRIRETIVSLLPKGSRPDLGKTYEPCVYKTLTMTSPETYFYLGQSIDFHKYWDYLLGVYTQSNPEAANSMKQIPAWAQSQGLDFNKNVLDALGSEYAMLLDWPGGAMVPDFAMVCEVARPDDFKPTLDTLLKNLTPLLSMDPNGGTLEDGKIEGYTFKTYRVAKLPLISPTLITSGDRFGIFLTQAGAKRMLGAKGDHSLAQFDDFKASGGDKRNGTVSLIYLNLGGLVDRTYTTAKPYLSLAAMMSPDMQKLMGSGQLPDKLTFTGDLGSLLVLSRVDDAGATVNSLSNVGTLPLLAGGASAVTAAVFTQQHMRRPARRAAAAPATVSASGEPTADGVKAELEELRAVIEAYAVAQDVPKGTEVTWTAIASYLVPDSPLQKRAGRDPLGNPYVLGVVGQTPATVAPETKAKFTDRDEAFWGGPAAP